MPKLDKQQFEATIREITKPLNGQYPRPWMTKLRDPIQAEVFVVGMNQSREYLTHDLSHEQHVDALFNEEPEACRKLYDDLNPSPSEARKNIDRFVNRLEEAGVHNTLETNVICYSTRMSKCLRENPHIGGAWRGEEIFRFLLSSIKPKVLIVHGVGASKKLKSIMDCDIPAPPKCADDGVVRCRCGAMLVIVIPSLGQPGFNMWHSWASAHLTRVADVVAGHLDG
ncbi:MAG: hypothetical protein OXR72_18265 [Gemmatimonadota bacterium]|nr:hypothetical protein [Gemmatimonadota bacterium]